METSSSDPAALPSDLEDEISAVNAIFAPTTLTVSKLVSSTSATISSTFSDNSSSPFSTCLVLALPTTPISFLLSIPSDYPSSSPVILNLASISTSLPKDTGPSALSLARSTLSRTWHQGEVCIYDLITELESALASTVSPCTSSDSPRDSHSGDDADGKPQQERRQQQQTPAPAPEWFIAAPTVEKKSVFQARACAVSSRDQALAAVSWLRAGGERKLAKATHHIWAYRIRSSPPSSSCTAASARPAAEVVYQDCDDDGETGAAAKVLGVMQAMDAWGVLVVVSRWYGGVKLGPDRFRIIGAVARGVVVEAGWDGEKGGAESRTSKIRE